MLSLVLRGRCVCLSVCLSVCHNDVLHTWNWVSGSAGHLGHLSRPGHRVIILTQCETRVFPVFEKNAQNAKRTFEMLK